MIISPVHSRDTHGNHTLRSLERSNSNGSSSRCFRNDKSGTKTTVEIFSHSRTMIKLQIPPLLLFLRTLYKTLYTRDKLPRFIHHGTWYNVERDGTGSNNHHHHHQKEKKRKKKEITFPLVRWRRKSLNDSRLTAHSRQRTAE